MQIQTIDYDGDTVKCRWARDNTPFGPNNEIFDECKSACQRFDGFDLNEVT